MMAVDGHPPKCVIFNTFFYSLLTGEGYNYARVKRVTSRKKVNIFQYDKVLVPVMGVATI